MEHQKYQYRIKTNYECKRDLLIPVAERYADSVCGKEPANTDKYYKGWVDKWNASYHSKMNELVKEMKLL